MTRLACRTWFRSDLPCRFGLDYLYFPFLRFFYFRWRIHHDPTVASLPPSIRLPQSFSLSLIFMAARLSLTLAVGFHLGLIRSFLSAVGFHLPLPVLTPSSPLVHHFASCYQRLNRLFPLSSTFDSYPRHTHLHLFRFHFCPHRYQRINRLIFPNLLINVHSHSTFGHSATAITWRSQQSQPFVRWKLSHFSFTNSKPCLFIMSITSTLDFDSLLFDHLLDSSFRISICSAY